MTTPVDGPRVSAAGLTRFIVETLRRLDVPEDEARIVADVLVAADLRGVKSHGVARLDRYVGAIEAGRIRPRAAIKVVSEWPAIALLDGGQSLGQVVSYRAMERCLDMAEKAGSACVTVTNSNHYGIAGYYAMMAPPRGMIGISLTNTRPHVTPTYGSARMLGTNPIAVAVPTGNGQPWVLDMATSTVAMGKVEVADRAGLPLQEGIAVDGRGEVTRDPQVILKDEGALLPLGGRAETGGYKGYGLAVLVDILSGVLPGASYSAIIRPGWGHSPIGHFFAAIRIDAVRPEGDFVAMMDEMIRGIKESPKADGQERIIIHGEPEFEAERTQRRVGILLQEQVADNLSAMADRFGVHNPLTESSIDC